MPQTNNTLLDWHYVHLRGCNFDIEQVVKRSLFLAYMASGLVQEHQRGAEDSAWRMAKSPRFSDVNVEILNTVYVNFNMCWVGSRDIVGFADSESVSQPGWKQKYGSYVKLVQEAVDNLRAEDRRAVTAKQTGRKPLSPDLFYIDEEIDHEALAKVMADFEVDSGRWCMPPLESTPRTAKEKEEQEKLLTSIGWCGAGVITNSQGVESDVLTVADATKSDLHEFVKGHNFKGYRTPAEQQQALEAILDCPASTGLKTITTSAKSVDELLAEHAMQKSQLDSEDKTFREAVENLFKTPHLNNLFILKTGRTVGKSMTQGLIRKELSDQNTLFDEAKAMGGVVGVDEAIPDVPVVAEGKAST
jgi:hypothetical protein